MVGLGPRALEMSAPPLDAPGWVRRWDRQQELYLPDREARFRAMFDLLSVALPPEFVAVDLACGPGALATRLLRRFPSARVIAVDYDPVLLHLGRSTTEALGPRLHWAEADLRDPGWRARLGPAQVDAVLSTTALHWLVEKDLRRLYGDLAGLLRPGGVFLNGDFLAYEADRPRIRAFAQAAHEAATPGHGRPTDAEDWEVWWRRLAEEPSLRAAFEERKRRFPHEHGDEVQLPLSVHRDALVAAGFAEVDTIWQSFDNRVLLAVR
jgi:SAM-dependent methyltransferase